MFSTNLDTTKCGVFAEQTIVYPSDAWKKVANKNTSEKFVEGACNYGKDWFTS